MTICSKLGYGLGLAQAFVNRTTGNLLFPHSSVVVADLWIFTSAGVGIF